MSKSSSDFHNTPGEYSLERLSWRNTSEAYLLIDSESGAIRDLNRSAELLLGRALENMVNESASTIVTKADWSKIEHFRSGPETSAPLAATLIGKNGNRLAVSGYIYKISDKMPRSMFVVLDTGRNAATADRLRRLTWATEAYARSMSALMHTHDVGDFTDEVCRSIVNDVYVLAWICLVDAAQGKWIAPVGKAGSAAGYLNDLRHSWDETLPEGRGPAGEAIRSGNPQLVRDAEADVRFVPWRERARRFGIRSAVTAPFKRGNSVAGALTVLASVPDAFGAEELRLFERLGVEVGHAIESFAQRRQLGITEEKYIRLIAATPTPIVAVGADSRIQLFNKSAETTFGYSAADAIGKPLDMLLPRGTEEAHSRLVRGFSGTGPAKHNLPAIREVLGRKADGTQFPIEVIVSRIDTGEGPLLTAIVRDLTQEKAMQTRLIHSEKMEAFGQLAGGISHDFNNLLSVIRGNAETLRDQGYVSTAGLKTLDQIDNACLHGADLTKRLLVFARSTPPSHRVVDVDAAVAEAAAILERTFKGTVAVVVSKSGGRCFIQADPTMLQTALLNLAFNARDAMPSGGTVRFSVRHETREGDGPGTVILSVEDTGTGIPQALLPRIFDPFFTTKPEGKGTGLGLAMVYNFVTHSAGTISVSSQTGRGARFIMRFPAAGREEPAAAIAPAAGPASLTGMRVLYVEDNEDLRDVYGLRLQRLGVALTSLASADEAMGLLAEDESFDVLITDLHLGIGMSGAQLAEKFCRRWPQTKVIVTTGYIGSEEAATVDPSWTVLQKPITTADLTAALLQFQRDLAS